MNKYGPMVLAQGPWSWPMAHGPMVQAPGPMGPHMAQNMPKNIPKNSPEKSKNKSRAPRSYLPLGRAYCIL